jgi:hypothetical protein
VVTQLVGVHGIGQQQRGRHQLLTSWSPALADGLERAAGRRLGSPDLDIAFYGDVFLAAPTPMSKGQPASVTASLEAIDDEECAELVVAASEVVTPADLQAAEQDVAKGYTRVPRPVQVVLRALDRRFGATAGVLYIGVFRQVYRYLRDPALKSEVDARVAAAAAEGCRVLIGHSLGSVVAYEHLCQHPDSTVRVLVTIGSPLGMRMIRHRLPCVVPIEELGIQTWVNIRDPRDPVACAGDLRGWWPAVYDRIVDNQGDAHAAERYLSKEHTGRALLDALPDLTS